jgi:hypothetical protein
MFTSARNPYFVALVFGVFVLLTVVAFSVINSKYRATLVELRKRADANQAKYEIVQTNMDKLYADLYRARATIVLQDAELAELRKDKNDGGSNETGA